MAAVALHSGAGLGCRRISAARGSLPPRPRPDLLQYGIVAASWPEKLRNIGARRQGNAQFLLMGWILIILCHAFANFRGRDADNWIGGCVVLRIAAENFNSQSPFLDALRFPSQSLFHHKAEKGQETACYG